MDNNESGASTQDILKVADVVMDISHHTVRRGTKELRLNRKEWVLLEYLMRNANTLLTREMMLQHVWGVDIDELTNTVDVHISFLRRKLDDGFKRKLIKTVFGYGYKFDSAQ